MSLVRFTQKGDFKPIRPWSPPEVYGTWLALLPPGEYDSITAAMKARIGRMDVVRAQYVVCKGGDEAKLKCSRCDCDRRFSEKMTDVNIGVQLVEDAIDGAFDRAYLVTADVDLVPAVHAALRRAPKSQVIVLLPFIQAHSFAAGSNSQRSLR